MRAFLRILFSLLLAGLAACAGPTLTPRPTPALLRVAVTDLTEPLLLDLAAAYALVNPAVAVAPSLAQQAALAGLLQTGQADLALTTAPDPALFATPLGYVPFRVVAHPTNPVETLSLPQARALFAGQVTDWALVGGRGGTVQAVARGDGGDAALAFGQTAFGPVTVTVNAFVAPTWDAMREIVAQNPNALGYLIAPRLDEGGESPRVEPLRVKALSLTGDDGARLDLRLLAVAQAAQDPTDPARAFLAWAQSPAGQAAVARRHEALGASRFGGQWKCGQSS